MLGPRPWSVALLVLSLTPLITLAGEPGADDAWFREHEKELVSLYTHLHLHPELSKQEAKTSERIAEELTKAGAEVTKGVGQYGVVGLIKNGEGPIVLIRSDLDALPVKEETGLSYASKATGVDATGQDVSVMHACGHDIHMTCLVGVAQWLATHKDRWSGTAVLVGQPAEEMISGAKAMLEDGLYTRFPKPNYALALHVTNDQAAGTLGYTSGPALAGSTALDVTIRGKGGHGASPHSTVDPIVLAALAILDFQTIISREINPIHPAVLTVGSIHGGSKHNIISDEVRLQLTLRYYRDNVREQLIEGIKRRVNALAQSHQAPEPEVKQVEGTPPTVNTPELVARLKPVLARTVGAANLKEVDPMMGAEDFGLFSQDGVPIFMFRLGSISQERVRKARAEGRRLPSLHSSLYYPEPGPTIQTGVKAMTAAVLELMPPRP